MRIGILADTHDELLRTRRAIEMLRVERVEALVHCGDLCGPEIVVACNVLPSYFVFGNHDADRVPELKRAAAGSNVTCLGWGGVVDMHGKKVGIAHGHMDIDIHRVLASHPDYLLFGHLHFRVDERRDSVRRINPGALHRADDFSVAILDLESDEVRFLVVPELS